MLHLRRVIFSGLVALTSTAVGLGTLSPATADPGVGDGRTTAREAVIADRALQRAQESLSGKLPGRDATIALRDLRVAYADLSPTEQQRADALLDRPYAGGSSVCGAHVCVHYRSGDGTASEAVTTMNVMESVWRFEVGTLGYRAPASDGSEGGLVNGSSRFDVYLSDLGDQGIYGYCAPEYVVSGQPNRATAYCALDDDFAEFPLPGDPSRRVTAAHEFFHAIQFNYDYKEDPWILEASAVWMEEEYADNVNDNRQYLPLGQLRRPNVPLDLFDTSQQNYYGNWIFIQRLSDTYGVNAIRAIWQRLDGSVGAPNEYSVQGIARYLITRGNRLRLFYPDFAAGNLVPGRIYSEGTAYPAAKVAKTWTIGKRKRSRVVTAALDHLTARDFVARPGPRLKGNWRLKIVFDGPKRSSGSGAFVQVVRSDGTVQRKRVFVKRNGNRIVKVGFSRSSVSRVLVTIANAGVRYTCDTNEPYACSGTPRSDNKAWKVKVSAFRGGS